MALAAGLGFGALLLCTRKARAYWQGGKFWMTLEALAIVVLIGVYLGWIQGSWPTARQGWAIPVTLLVLAGCSAMQGLGAGSRCGAALAYLVILGLLVTMIFALPDLDTENLRIQSGDMNPELLLPFLIPGAALLLQEKSKEKLWPWTLILILGAGAVSALVTGALSYPVASSSEGAFYEMARGIRLFGGTERLESMVAATMTIGWFCTLSLLLACLGELGKRILPGEDGWFIWGGAALGAGIYFCQCRIETFLLPASGIILWYVVPTIWGAREKMKREAQ